MYVNYVCKKQFQYIMQGVQQLCKSFCLVIINIIGQGNKASFWQLNFLKAHTYTYGTYAHIQGTCTYTGYMHIYRAHAHIQGTCTYTGHMHIYRAHAHIQGTCTYTGHMHIYRAHAHIQGTCTYTEYMHIGQ